MSSLLQLVNRVRAWRGWRTLRRPSDTLLTLGGAPTVRPILREVTPHGVRVYSLCGSCGAHLGASATLCDTCARSRPMPSA
jgi:hypothetical protein